MSSGHRGLIFFTFLTLQLQWTLFLVWEPLPLPLLRLLVLAGVWRLLKLLLWRHRPMPRVTRLSSIVLQIITQSFLNCLVRMAYRKGLQQLFRGSTNTVNTYEHNNI